MAFYGSQQLAKSLSTGRLSRAFATNLDTLLLWLSNPDNPRAAAMDQAIGGQDLSRHRAADRAYRLLDQLLFTHEGQALATLGLPEGTDPSEAKLRYRRLVQVYHPDRHPNRIAWATQRTEQINRAFAAYRKGASGDHNRNTRKPSDRPDAGRRLSDIGAQILDGLDAAAERIWPDAWPRLLSRMRRLESSGRLALASAAALAGLVIIVAAVHLGDRPKPIPKIVHYPMTITPAEMPGSSRRPPREPAPERERSLRIAAAEPPHNADAAAGPDEPKTPLETTKPAIGIKRIAPTHQPTQEPTQLSSSVTGSPATDATPPLERSPPATSDIAPKPPRPDGPAVDTPTQDRGESQDIPPLPNLAASAAGPAASATPTAPSTEGGTEIPPSPEPRIMAAQPTALPMPGQEPPWPPPETPWIPTANPPASPEPPDAPAPPMQISSAAIALPTPPAIASAAGECTGVPDMLLRFQQNYQAGILDQFMALYSPHAKENDLASWFAIRQTYAEWFHTTSARRIRFEQLRVEPASGGQRCAAAALFQVSYLDDQSLLVTKAGVIRVLFERDGPELRILRIRY